MTDAAWALTPAGLARVLAETEAGRERIVECGSGASTVAIGRALASRGGDGRLFSLEHDPLWARRTRQLLEDERLGGVVELIEAPLRPHRLAGPAGWYDPAALARLPDAIDLLLVDGPPADLAPDRQTRYPALPLLAARLAPGALVILDDIHRPGERAVLERWRSETEIEFALHARERLAIGVFSSAQGPAQAGMAFERGT